MRPRCWRPARLVRSVQTIALPPWHRVVPVPTTGVMLPRPLVWATPLTYAMLLHWNSENSGALNVFRPDAADQTSVSKFVRTFEDQSSRSPGEGGTNMSGNRVQNPIDHVSFAHDPPSLVLTHFSLVNDIRVD